MKLEKIVALVPMRHDSKRVPGKNYRPPMCGKPLYAHIIETLLAVPEIDRIVVDTDSTPVLEGLAKDYPPRFKRSCGPITCLPIRSR